MSTMLQGKTSIHAPQLWLPTTITKIKNGSEGVD